MKLLSTALLAAGLVSLAACGGGGANNAAAANNTADIAPVDELNSTDLNGPLPSDLNATNAVDTNVAGNVTNSTGNTL